MSLIKICTVLLQLLRCSNATLEISTNFRDNPALCVQFRIGPVCYQCMVKIRFLVGKESI